MGSMKHLSSILIAVCMTLFMSFQTISASASTELITFTIDKKVYSKMSDAQKSGLIQKLQELNNFIESKIKTKIPQDLSDKLKDLKIKISFSDQLGRDGLFVPQESGEHSISIQLVQLYSNGIYALLAHEIYHAIHFHINPNEVTWVREGMAQLFEYITTNELNGMNLSAAIRDPMTPLLGVYDIQENNPAQYGHNQLYFYYLFSHCGRDQIFWDITKGQQGSGLKGSFLIDAVLAELKIAKTECLNFTESAIAFEVAKTHNQFQFLNENEKEKEKYFIIGSSIDPVFIKPASEDSLKIAIETMPVLSSFRMPLRKYIQLNGECKNCAVYFADRDFPYSITDILPDNSSTYDVILVKLRRD